MKWVRQHVKTGARLALLALFVQFALSFGHFHALAAPAAQTTLTQADLAYIGTSVGAPDAASSLAQPQSPRKQDNDQHSPDACAICAVLALAHSVVFANPPSLLLPQAVELLYLATEAEFAHLKHAHSAFRSRAPPLS